MLTSVQIESRELIQNLVLQSLKGNQTIDKLPLPEGVVVDALVEKFNEELRRVAQLFQETQAPGIRNLGKLYDFASELYRQESNPKIVDNVQLRTLLLTNIEVNLGILEDANLRESQAKSFWNFVHFLGTASMEESIRGYFHEPTGAGKSRLMAFLARLCDVRTLILVPRTNLLGSNRDEMLEIPGIQAEDIGLYGGNYSETGRKFTLCTYQSLAGLRNADSGDWKLVLCDESHRSLGEVTSQHLDELEASDLDSEATDGVSQNAILLGFTATTDLRSKTVQKFYKNLVSRTSYAELVKAGKLAKFKLVRTDGIIYDTDMPDGAISEEEEIQILDREQIYQKLIDKFLQVRARVDEPLKTAVFCANIKECDKFRQIAVQAGLKSEIITSREGRRGNEDALKEAERKLLGGEIDMIITVEKLGEGWNLPPLNTAILARATLSPVRVLQPAGRVIREFQGKRHAYIFETEWKFMASTSLEDNEDDEETLSGQDSESTGSTKNSRKRKRPINLAQALYELGEENLHEICEGFDGESITIERELTLEELILEIKSLVPTAEDWARMIKRSKEAFEINGMKLNAIARKFGVERNPINNHGVHLALGRKIYGEDHEALMGQFTLEELILEIKSLVPTAEDWARMIKKDRQEFEINGMKLNAIGGRFGVKKSPVNSNSVHLELGRKIYGEDHEALMGQLTSEELIQEVKNLIPTAEDWARMSSNEKAEFKINGMKLNAIARKFGVERNPINNHGVHLALGRKIYGVEHPALQYEKPKELTLSELILEIKERIPTSEEWAKMMVKDKRQFEINGMKLNAIARKFSVEENPIGSHRFHLELGRKIYGEEHPALQYEKPKELTLSELIQGIRNLIPTPEEWARMTKKNRQEFEISGMKLNAIARKFGIEENPISNHTFHLELGRKIYA